MIAQLFNEILYRPLFNAVIFLYDILPGNDFGLAIIILTVLIRFFFLPLTIKTIKSQKALSEINPKIKEIKEKHKKDMQAQSAAIMALYKENNINPLSGCLPLLIQIPIILALYRAFIAGLDPDNLHILYSFISNPGEINNLSFGLVEITKRSIPLTFLASGAQFLQMKHSTQMMSGNNGQASELQAMSKQMLYFLPVIIIIIGWNLPAGLMIYWITTTVVSMLEQAYVRRKR